jgi:hypothetical protein
MTTQRRPRRPRLVLAALLPLIAATACSGGGTSPFAARPTTSVASTTPTPTPSGTSPGGTAAGQLGGTAGATSGPGSTPGSVTAPESATTPGSSGSADQLPALGDLSVPAFTPSTRTEQLEMALASGAAPTLQQAIDVFAVSMAPIPGATPSTLPNGDGFSATIATNLIEQFRSQLSPAQLAAVDAFDGVEVATLDADGKDVAASTTTPPPPTTTTGHSGLAEERASTPPAPSGPATSPSSTVPPALYARYKALLQQTITDWKAKHPELFTDLNGFVLNMSADQPVGSELVWMNSGELPADRQICKITVFPKTYNGPYNDGDVKFAFAHELFHCVQTTWNPSHWADGPGWLVDGSATFAAEDLYRGAFVPNDEFLPAKWFFAPNTPLATSSYNAWALFEAFHQQYPDDPVQNQYSSIETMIDMPLGTSTADLLTVGNLDDPVFASLWTSTSLRPTGFDKPEWELDWPGTDATAGPHDNTVPTSPDEARGLGTFNVDGQADFVHGNVLVGLQSDVGLVDVLPAGGPMMTYTQSGTVSVADGQHQWFCTNGDGCPCPSGTHRLVEVIDVTPPMIVSFAAKATASSAVFNTMKWDPDADCVPDPTPDTSPPGSSGAAPAGTAGPASASANGDPHMTTFNGLTYDFMTLGEYVTSTDPKGGLTVQERHAPAGFGTAISAVAAGDGTHRVTFTAHAVAPDAPITVRLDGKPSTATTFAAGTIQVASTGSRDWTLTWPDGSVVAVRWNDGFFVSVALPPDRAARVVGVLGTRSDNFLDDLELPDGTRASPADHYKAFADAWLVTAKTSLFDYDPGQDTGTFQTAPSPAPPVVPPTAATVDLCRKGLGAQATGAEVDSCAFDVTATGQTSFIAAYQPVVQARVATIPTGTKLVPPGIVVGVPTKIPPPTTAGPGAAAPAGAPSLSGVVSWSSTTGTGHNLTGAVTLAKDAVLVAQAACPAGGKFDLTLKITARADQVSTSVGLCGDAWRSETYNAGDTGETHEGEGYVLIREAGAYDVSVSTDTSASATLTVALTSDPRPTVIAADGLPAAGSTTTLAGVGGTLVLGVTPGDKGGDWTITGGDELCGQVYYIAGPQDPGTSPDDLGGVCWHHTDIGIGPTTLELPIVIFNRGSTPVQVTVTRKD